MRTYRGHVEKGIIVLDEPAELYEGDLVQITEVPRTGRKTWRDMTDEEWREGIREIGGSWEDDRTAEEIIADIRGNRVSKTEPPQID